MEVCIKAVDSINTRLGRHKPLVLVLFSVVSTYFLLKFNRFWNKSEKSLWARFKGYVFGIVRRFPSVQRRIQNEMGPKIASIVHSIHECDKEKDFIRLVF
jgi:hypothetical protein